MALTLAALVSVASGVVAGEGEALAARLSPFLKQHCFDCHQGEKPEGGLDLATASLDLADADLRQRWVYLHDRVARGEMPPSGQEPPDAAAKTRFLSHLSDALSLADRAGREVVLRRLNRNEYQHTVGDLFGVHVDVSRLLPDDSVDQGFDTNGASLSLSAEQLVLYVQAADLVLDEVFGPPRRLQQVHRAWNSKDSRALRSSVRVSDNGITLLNEETFVIRESSAPVPGTYRLRFQARAIGTEKPVVIRVMGGVSMQIPPYVSGFYEIPPGRITTIEIEDRALETFDSFGISLMGGFPHSRVPDSYTGPGLFIGEIAFEGPLEPWPPASRKELLGDIDPATGTLADIRTIVQRILPLAFRRTTSAEEAAPFVRLAKQALEEGLPFEGALRRALKGVLCAPEFLFLEERTAPAVDGHPGTIDDFALASRLSYFLWSSMPDEGLLTLAGRGQLHQPHVLRTQVERMLGDAKAERFVKHFTGQWLRLRDMDFTVPDRLLYPEYNELVRAAMLGESYAFFREILTQNASVQNFIDSDFLMLNEPLAEFYGIEGVQGLAFRRVELPEDSVRGGVLTQASVLKVSADGTRTSPVLRGAWILKHFLGTPSPPPPPSVTAIEPDIRGATTIREQLARHRAHESCNSCHRRIDPPGFALESFDVIGGYRDWYRTRGEGQFVRKPRHPLTPNAFVLYRRGPDVDATGTAEDGRSFADIRQYKRLLLEDETLMPQALTQHLLTYGLGRELGFSDRPEVQRIVASLKKDNYGLRSMIHAVVQSPMFRSP